MAGAALGRSIGNGYAAASAHADAMISCLRNQRLSGRFKIQRGVTHVTIQDRHCRARRHDRNSHGDFRRCVGARPSRRPGGAAGRHTKRAKQRRRPHGRTRRQHLRHDIRLQHPRRSYRKLRADRHQPERQYRQASSHPRIKSAYARPCLQSGVRQPLGSRLRRRHGPRRQPAYRAVHREGRSVRQFRPQCADVRLLRQRLCVGFIQRRHLESAAFRAGNHMVQRSTARAGNRTDAAVRRQRRRVQQRAHASSTWPIPRFTRSSRFR